MKAYRVVLLVVDHDRVGAQGIRDVLEHSHYPNHCISPEVKDIQERDIGEWRDDHPLNITTEADAEYRRLFGGPVPARQDGKPESAFDELMSVADRHEPSVADSNPDQQ